MSSIVFEFEQLYNQYFGKKPEILPIPAPKADKPYGSVDERTFQVVDNQYVSSIEPYAYANQKQIFLNGKQLSDEYLGVDIWLPTTIIDDFNVKHYLPYSTVRISGSSTWVETPLAERKGSVKELYSVDDYQISINGFFIDKEKRLFPMEDLIQLKAIHERGKPLQIKNALIECYLDVSDRVVLKSFELPEVRGGKKSMRPFSMKLVSDSIFTLIWEG